MNLLFKALIFLDSIIFPQCCLLCGKYTKNIWCKDCKKDIYQKTIFKIEKVEDNFYFEKIVYIFKYEGKIRDLLLNYKFKDKSYLYEIFSEIIIKNKKICGILKKYDIIIPVPIHKKRKNKRGYNQSELISRKIAKKISNLTLENNVLIKIKNNKPQNSLNRNQRKENVKGVYKILDKEKIINKKIIIFDDIFTTGNTVNECSKILKQNGAKRILILTMAKD